MAEAVIAVGFAGALVQLAEFSYKLLKRMINVRSRIAPEYAKSFREIENQLPLLLSIVDRLRGRVNTHRISEADEQALTRTVDGCHDQVRRLDTLLDNVFPQNTSRLQQIWRAMKSLRKAKRFMLVQKALENYKSTLTLYLALESRSRVGPEISSSDRYVQYHVPSVHVSRFVGRKGPIVDMGQKLGPPVEPSASPRIAVVLGMGGLGKTQFVLEYCQRAFTSRRFSAVFWADASSPTSLSRSFASLSGFLSGPRKDFADPNASITFVKGILSKWPEPWLLVYDNFDQPGMFRETPIHDYFPAGSNGSIVVISRHAEAERLGSTIELEVLSEDEGLDLLLRRSGLDTNSERAIEGRSIVRRLGSLPLAIDQAGAYISARKIEFQDFMNHFNERKAAVLKHTPEFWEYKKNFSDKSNDSALDVFTTWEMLF